MMKMSNEKSNNFEIIERQQNVNEIIKDKDLEIEKLKIELVRVRGENICLKTDKDAILKKFISAKKQFQSDQYFFGEYSRVIELFVESVLPEKPDETSEQLMLLKVLQDELSSLNKISFSDLSVLAKISRIKADINYAYEEAGMPKNIPLTGIITKLKHNFQKSQNELDHEKKMSFSLNTKHQRLWAKFKLVDENLKYELKEKKRFEKWIETSSAPAVVLGNGREFLNYKISVYESQLSNSWSTMKILRETMNSIEADLKDRVSALRMTNPTLLRCSECQRSVVAVMSREKNLFNLVDYAISRIQFLQKEFQRSIPLTGVVQCTALDPPAGFRTVCGSSDATARVVNVDGSTGERSTINFHSTTFPTPLCKRVLKQEVVSEAEGKCTRTTKRIGVSTLKLDNDDCQSLKRVKMEDVLASVDDVGIKQEQADY